jgi:hypothetical protein
VRLDVGERNLTAPLFAATAQQVFAATSSVVDSSADRAGRIGLRRDKAGDPTAMRATYSHTANLGRGKLHDE